MLASVELIVCGDAGRLEISSSAPGVNTQRSRDRRFFEVKFLIGAFPTLFGTDLGLRLQQWARLGARLMDSGVRRAGKVLLWALGPNNLPVVGAIGMRKKMLRRRDLQLAHQPSTSISCDSAPKRNLVGSGLLPGRYRSVMVTR